jgi:glycosyltransferase involved in cell wall biosynthesis
MRKKTIGLYDPYLDVLGGGEKHILSIIQAVNKDADIHIFWDKNIYKKIVSRLNVTFRKPPIFEKNIFKLKKNIIQKLNKLRNFDYFFYISDGSYFLSSAKKNFIFCMIPDKALYNMNLVNKLKTFNYKFISNSRFTKNWLSKWNIKSEVIYPYMDEVFIKSDINSLKKEKIILSVGRFFKHLHSKRQDLLISCFKDLKRKSSYFADCKLILAGGVKEQDKKYFSLLEKEFKNHESIIFKPNITFKELCDLYTKSMVFWHMAGFGIDDKVHPELTEHLGLAPLEAMSMGCITFAYNAGGIKETIDDGENGFMFNSTEELINKTIKVAKNQFIQKKVKKNAKDSITNNFSYNRFKKTVKQIIVEKS